jgi:trimethylamine:corrinoid methyltransferase-like protein
MGCPDCQSIHGLNISYLPALSKINMEIFYHCKRLYQGIGSDEHQWLELGKPSMYSLAREKVQEILNAPVVDPLPEGVIQKLDDILTAADKEIKE